MRRQLCTFASTASLLLCVVTVVLGVRSYWIGDIWTVAAPLWKQPIPRVKQDRVFQVALSRGCCAMTSSVAIAGPGIYTSPLILHSSSTEEGSTLRTSDPLALVGASRAYLLLGPAVVFAIPPALCLAFRRGRRGSNQLKCRVCSYDLTDNTSGVCPECGTAVVSAKFVTAGAGSHARA
jgi:hypothetical protein